MPYIPVPQKVENSENNIYMASKTIRAKTYAFIIAVSLNLLSHSPDTFAFNNPSESDMPLGIEVNGKSTSLQNLTSPITESNQILVEGLKRLPAQNKVRDKNGIYINSLLKDLPGIIPMRRDERETNKAYFNFSFRYKKEDFKNLSIEKFREALGAELGLAVEPSYEPLNNASLYVPLTKPSRHRLNEQYWNDIDPSRFSLPVCERIYKEESVCLHHKALMGTKEDMEMIVAAIKKIYNNVDELI